MQKICREKRNYMKKYKIHILHRYFLDRYDAYLNFILATGARAE